MIELRFQVPDPRRRLAAVRLAHQLRERLPHELTRNGRAWELTATAPDVARFEYQLELIDRDGRSEWILDPENPKRASGPWGFKSVWEEPGYAPPEWVGDEPVGEPESVTIPSRILKTDLPALIWAHPDATERSPLLVAHDGPEYAEHSALLTYLGQLPPLRAALIGPVDRNEIYSASARYSRALAEEILPELPPAPPGSGSAPASARSPSSTRTGATRRASTRSSSSRAVSSAEPRATSGTSRATSGSPASSAASTAIAPSGRFRSCSRAAPSSRTWPRTGHSRSRSAPGATTRACSRSATVTIGSRGATPSTPNCAACSRGSDLTRRHLSLYSPAIGADGRVIAYGHWGRPLLAFPSQEGPAWQYEERGMVDAIGGLIEEGRVKVYAVDSFDSDSWYHDGLSLEERAQLHGRYEDWILNQVVPFIQADSNTPEIMVTGVSFGAYHAANFALRHAHVFPLAICQSGVYDVSVVAGGERGDAVYFNNPNDYVQHLGGDHLDWLRGQVNLLLIAGQGQWEDTTGALESTRRFAGLLGGKVSSTSSISGVTTRRTTGPRGGPRSRIISPASYDHPPASDRPPARHRGGLAPRVRAPAGPGRADRARRRTHELTTERITNEPFDLRSKPRYSLVIDRLGWWGNRSRASGSRRSR